MSSDHGNTTRNHIIYTAHSAAMRAARRTGKEPRREATPTATFHPLQVKRSPTSGSNSSRLSDSRRGTSAQELYLCTGIVHRRDDFDCRAGTSNDTEHASNLELRIMGGATGETTLTAEPWLSTSQYRMGQAATCTRARTHTHMPDSRCTIYPPSSVVV
jgi:hypothetical protein